MSTRAVIACTTGDGTWRGVWNHWGGAPEDLGNALLARVAAGRGDLAAVCRRAIDDQPGGWSDFAAGAPTDDGGCWEGTFTAEAVVFRTLPDAHFLYLFDLSGRRLLVFPVDEGACAPLAEVTFDAAGRADPPDFPTESDPDADDAPEAAASEEALLAAARAVLGPRTLEVQRDEATGLVELFVVVRAVSQPVSPDEVALTRLRASGIEAEAGDELLFPHYHRADDEPSWFAQCSSGVAALLGLPLGTYEALRRALRTASRGR